VGQEATFTVDAYPGRSFDATITQLRYAPMKTKGDVVTYTAVLSVENEDMLLRPGMTATATITVAKEADALLVPVAALRYAPPAGTGDRAGRRVDRADHARARQRQAARGSMAPASGCCATASRCAWRSRRGRAMAPISSCAPTDLKEGDQVILSQRGAG
jgi:HlyD family secretion protein